MAPKKAKGRSGSHRGETPGRNPLEHLGEMTKRLGTLLDRLRAAERELAAAVARRDDAGRPAAPARPRTTATTTAPRKPAARKPVARKPVARKPAAPKPAARKPPA